LGTPSQNTARLSDNWHLVGASYLLVPLVDSSSSHPQQRSLSPSAHS
jgi:hypothetical protein